MNRLFNRLFLSATLVVLILFMALWQWLQLNHEFSRNQIQQSLHLELAEHMAHINPLLSQGITSDAALKEAFHDFMLLGPSLRSTHSIQKAESLLMMQKRRRLRKTE